jgi:hypothetical protein
MKYRAEEIGGVWCVVSPAGDVVERCGLGPAFKALAERIADRMNEGLA